MKKRMNLLFLLNPTKVESLWRSLSIPIPIFQVADLESILFSVNFDKKKPKFKIFCGSWQQLDLSGLFFTSNVFEN
jgi:hypothetical protein